MSEPWKIAEFEASPDMLEGMSAPAKPTIEQVRKAVLAFHMISLGPQDFPADKRRLFGDVPQTLHEAVVAGRLFDLGHFPNALMKRESGRAAKLYERRYLGHPFREPYALFHTWELGGALYLVIPNADGYRFLACELQPVLMRGMFMLLISDMILLEKAASEEGKYRGDYIPSPMKAALMEQGDAPAELLDQKLQFCNIGDPVMLALLLLSTDGISVKHIEAPAKLNRARLKNRKPAIPAHWHVETGDYITALMARGQPRPKGEPLGGHHASPIPHLRRGHERNLHERHGGGVTWVRDCVVNLVDGIEQAPRVRSWYSLHREAHA